MHLSRLTKPLNVNPVLKGDIDSILMLTKCTLQIIRIKRASIRLADQQAIILVVRTEEALVFFNLCQSFLNLSNQRLGQILLSMAVFRLGAFQNQAAF